MSKRKPMSDKTKKKIIIVLSILLLLIGGGALGINLYIDSMLNKMDKTAKISATDVGVNTNTKEKSEDKKIINIALLGIDNDGASNRSDAIKIISVNLEEDSVTINSVQRDNLVYIPGSVNRYDKLNHAYQYGGAELTLETLNYNFDLDITQYVAFNFDSVYKIVDLLGGVDITLSDLEATCIGITTGGGTYTLDGEKALNYARLRATDSDYGRMQRQTNVIASIMSTMVGKGVMEMMNVVTKALPYIETNMTNSEIKKYVTNMVGFSMDKLTQYQIPTNGYGDILQSVYLYGYGPHYILKDFSATVEQLHHNIYKDEEYTASEQVLKIEEEILTNYYTAQ